MKALLKVGYGCNDHCAFCHTLDIRDVQGEADEIVRKIHRAKELGHSMVVLSGGEPTIRPELPEWAELVASLGMDFGLVTNGRMLAYDQYVDRLLRSRLTYVYLSLHGGDAKTHNLMVRSQAFDETYGALENLSGKGIDLHVNCVVTQQNIRHLRAVIDAIVPYPDAQLKFSMVEPKGGGEKLFDRIMPRVSDVAAAALDAIAYGKTLGVSACHGALPLCLVPGYEDAYDDLKSHQFRTMSEIGEPDFFPVDDQNKVQPPACDGCALRGPCPGLYSGYYEQFGAGELKAPVTLGARSNSFDYVFERRLRTEVLANGEWRTATATECALRDGEHGITPWSIGRDLVVRNGGRLALFRAESRDFSDVELEHIKRRSGQLYYDISKKAAPNDFAKDLVKLERASICGPCPHATQCTGIYEPQMEPVFEQDDKRLRGLLSELEGDVLDIGAGEGPYLGVFETAVHAGRVRYTALEPDPKAAARLRREHAWAHVVLGSGEDLSELDGQQFDVVLFLRSWNHLRDPQRALAQVRDRLRPGGRVIVADNVAFGLARVRAHSEMAKASDAELEHLRNDDSTGALKTLGISGFSDVREHWKVSETTSNQWVVDVRADESRPGLS